MLTQHHSPTSKLPLQHNTLLHQTQPSPRLTLNHEANHNSQQLRPFDPSNTNEPVKAPTKARLLFRPRESPPLEPTNTTNLSPNTINAAYAKPPLAGRAPGASKLRYRPRTIDLTSLKTSLSAYDGTQDPTQFQVNLSSPPAPPVTSPAMAAANLIPQVPGSWYRGATATSGKSDEKKSMFSVGAAEFASRKNLSKSDAAGSSLSMLLPTAAVASSSASSRQFIPHTTNATVEATKYPERHSTLMPTSSYKHNAHQSERLPRNDGDSNLSSTFAHETRIPRSHGSSWTVTPTASTSAIPQTGTRSTPMTPKEALYSHENRLTPFERLEIIEYPKIYFLGRKMAQKINSHPKNNSAPSSSEKAKARASHGNNFGYDDDRGDFHVVARDHLCYRYEIFEVLGKGSFGQVVKVFDHATGMYRAVKIIRNKKRFHCQALVEVKILDRVNDWDREDTHHIVRKTSHFYFRSHLCIAFELLSINLYEFIKNNSFQGCELQLIRRFAVQMLKSLKLLHDKKVIHCDLKPENVLLRHPEKSDIKVIDFGSSCFENEQVYTYIQSRFYRSPEVILEVSYSSAVDMWSLGCILAELYTGYPLFPGENEQEQLACIMEVMGPPPETLLDQCNRKSTFFDSSGNAKPVVNSKGRKRQSGTRPLSSALKCQDLHFMDFIERCLAWDPARRLTPKEGLNHPWIRVSQERTKSTQRRNTFAHVPTTLLSASPSAQRRRDKTESAKTAPILASSHPQPPTHPPPPPQKRRESASKHVQHLAAMNFSTIVLPPIFRSKNHGQHHHQAHRDGDRQTTTMTATETTNVARGGLAGTPAGFSLTSAPSSLTSALLSSSAPKKSGEGFSSIFVSFCQPKFI